MFFTAPLLVDIGATVDLFAAYPTAPSDGLDETDNGMGGFDSGFGLGGDEGGEEEPGGGEEEDFGLGGRGGAAGGLGESEPEDEDEVNPIPVIDGVGTKMQTVNVHTSKGVRPTHHNFPATTRSAIFNIVCVTGLVDVEQQWKEYENSFASAMGYYPDRDKPIYQYLEVERREVGEKEWENITDKTSYYFPSLFPSMHRMPKAFHNSAPDIVAPQHFDPVLTGPIPAIFDFDYRPYISHSKLAENRREFPEFTATEEEEEVNDNDILNATIKKPGNRERPVVLANLVAAWAWVWEWVWAPEAWATHLAVVDAADLHPVVPRETSVSMHLKSFSPALEVISQIIRKRSTPTKLNINSA